MFTLRLCHETHTRQFQISDAGSAGWEVREEVDSEVIRVAHYFDWHRVERAQREFERHVRSLRQLGWTDMA
jgi:hypothetical protein